MTGCPLPDPSRDWALFLDIDGVLNRTGFHPGTSVGLRSWIEVELAHDAMTLESASDAAVDRGANLALIGDELMQFRRAEQIGARRWRIAGLDRAWRGIGGAVHSVGERFVLIETGAAIAVPLTAIAVGVSVSVLASGVGDTAGPVTASVAITGASILPPAPVHVTKVPTAEGGVRIAWVRRSRAGWRWRDGGDAPLGEESEAYRVTVTPNAGAARSVVTTAPWIEASAAERAAGPIAVTVCQLGTNGASPPAYAIV